mmetsp:Transcript_92106/g.210888  ORF Transcript_92106/g.210888 Transcript_92106/m.210888 type:complete len:80 (+) Transcript_92106:791-1030(+)
MLQHEDEGVSFMEPLQSNDSCSAEGVKTRPPLQMPKANKVNVADLLKPETTTLPPGAERKVLFDDVALPKLREVRSVDV